MFKDLINRNTISQDFTAGLVLGVESVPSGIATGLLALVNPLYGLYAYMTGVATGAFFTSSVFMSVQGTSAMALVVASVPQVISGPNKDASLFALAILTGIIMLGAGLLKLGSLVRFVPNAVMAGFVNAVAINIILGQLNNFTGYSSSGPNQIAKAINLLRNWDKIDQATLMVGIVTIILIVTLEKTRLKAMGLVVAIIVASLLVPLFNADTVALVSAEATIPSTLPRPVLPPLSLFPALIIPAFSLAFVGLVQGTGVSKNFVNPDGSYPDSSQDFSGQGIANLVAGLFQGMPVGGSMSATSLVTNAGARSRLANIIAGVVMAVIILLFGTAVGKIAMPCLAALLIVIGFRTLKPEQARTVWRTGLIQQTVMGLTFIACILIPLQYAVLLGVALAILLFVVQQSNKIVIKQWTRPEGDFFVEVEPPAVVPAHEITFLVTYGSLFFATAPLFEKHLPQITQETDTAVVILALRGESEMGSTFFSVLERYANKLKEHNSKLLLSGVTPQVQTQLVRTGLIEVIGRGNTYLWTEYVGQSGVLAWADAERWLENNGHPVADHTPIKGPFPTKASEEAE